MNETLQIIFSVLGIVGIGGIIAGVVTFLLNKRKELEFSRLEQKEKRYKSCLLYMDVYFKPENIKYLSSRQADIHESEDVLEYLKAEYHEMLLYASKEVILAVKAFISNPTQDNFLKTILSMRRDLWTRRTDLDLDSIRIELEDIRKK